MTSSSPPSDSLFDPSFASQALGEKIVSVEADSLSGEGGNSGVVHRLTLTFEDEKREKEVYVMKRDNEKERQRSRELGLAREGLFYREFGTEEMRKKLFPFLPLCRYSFGDIQEGKKVILMEDLSEEGVQVGYYFKAHSPLNWKKKEEGKLTEDQLSGKHVQELTTKCFSAAARLQAPYWGRVKDLLEGEEGEARKGWMRGADWEMGEGKEAFEVAQNLVVNIWKKRDGKEEEGKGINTSWWDPEMVELVNKSIERVSWEGYLEKRKAFSTTLVHGDFHPANFMVRVKKGEEELGEVLLMDWEMVGFGWGPQECGQFVISHVEPQQRREIEKKVFEEGYVEVLLEELKKRDPPVEVMPTKEELWRDYRFGGVERWVWFVVFLASVFPGPMVKYFHDQTLAFARDHGVTSENVGMPRV